MSTVAELLKAPDVLMEVRWGFYEGTWWLPVVYEGSHWDFWRSRRERLRFRSSGRLLLTKTALTAPSVWGGRSLVIPLTAVVGVYSARSVGRKRWGKDCLTRIVWMQDSRVLSTAVAVMGGDRKLAVEFRRRLVELVEEAQERDGAAGTPQTVPEGYIDRIRRDNCSMTAWSWGALLGVAMLCAAWVLSGWNSSRPEMLFWGFPALLVVGLLLGIRLNGIYLMRWAFDREAEAELRGKSLFWIVSFGLVWMCNAWMLLMAIAFLGGIVRGNVPL